VLNDRFGRDRATVLFLRQQVLAHLVGQALPCYAVPGIRQVPPTRAGTTVVPDDVEAGPTDTTVVSHDDAPTVAQVGELGEADAGVCPSSPSLPVRLHAALPARRLVHRGEVPLRPPTEPPPMGLGSVRVGSRSLVGRLCSFRRRRGVEIDRRDDLAVPILVGHLTNGPEGNNTQHGRPRDQPVAVHLKSLTSTPLSDSSNQPTLRPNRTNSVDPSRAKSVAMRPMCRRAGTTAAQAARSPR